MTNFEIDTRVPLIVRAPDASENGKRTRQLVEFVDIYPTLCDLARIPIPAELEGTSFTPLLADTNRPWKKAVFSQFLRDGIWIAPDGVAYMGRCVRTNRYRYVEWTKKNSDEMVARELYDHRTDPQENENVAHMPANREVISNLAAQLHAGWRSVVPE
jgi:arylsulfatase A-like enzyme